MLLASKSLVTRGGPYAVVGGNAVAAWVATVDEAAVRNTQNVDILIRRSDFNAAKTALESSGFIHRSVASMDLFLDNASPHDAVHIVFANEIVRPGEHAANPMSPSPLTTDAFERLNLEALVRIKLTAFRDKDRTHLRDLIAISLIDATWTNRFPAPLAARLQQLLDTPDG